MKKKNQTSHTNRYILLGLAVFCALMMILSSFSDRASGPFKVLANVTVIPLQQGINQIGGWLGDMKDNFSTMQQLREENQKLQEQIDALTTENNYLQEESYEYERLQELYELDQNYADYEKTAAHVIGKDSGNWFSTFTIDKGSQDGITVDMNVLAGSGLVGIVTDVGPTWAKVRSIIDDSSNISGMVLSTSDTCIVSGDLSLMSSGQIAFDQMANNDNVVAVGDQIVTSYISDKYLQGILIGTISEVNVDSNNLTRSGYIIPAVDFNNIQEVLVITTTKAEMTGENVTE
ncbi:rod shape-determining protein MreC [Ruminococcus sp. CLA-AA-H200]|uniref:Cell shape-determining protein MreC n=1 Tax=Ruminococcus turbiniformis TaxID=2881258 RepID=A0ABS8FT60_9FIRM|nr:rod shape-determining protein MreC [Ruminococcus turbiniformis]MCC2253185.1 rod shape-determining protein MreC [Ruminococcus turbiniformis]